MTRSNIGVSKISVSPEIDPGFGPDTEQRRVEFAAKLEEEAFSISIGDATKLAKANLITALHIWKRSDLIPKVKKLNLRDVMIVWLFFFVVYTVRCWLTLNKDLRKKILKKKKKFSKFLDVITRPESDQLPEKLLKVKLNLRKIRSIREKMGGDLVLAIRRKNHLEVNKLYEITYSKLPKSLRDEFFTIITGLDFGYKQLLNLVKSGNKSLLEDSAGKILKLLEKEDEYHKQRQRVSIINEIVDIFYNINCEKFDIDFDKSEKQTKKKIEDNVKKYYGIE